MRAEQQATRRLGRADSGRRGFRIRGMDCAEEVAALERELAPLLGGEGELGFDLLNGPQLQLFLGTLDGSGRGDATLALPPGLVLPPMTVNMAAIVLDPTLQLSAVTNAVSLQLQ